MTVSLFEYVRRTIDSGLLSDVELQEFIANLPAEQRPVGGEGLARQLVQAKKLTTYQATAIYQGKGKRLCLGKYVILGTLGRGGMGVVYKALHRPMQRVVALKMLSASAKLMPGAIQRFQREVRAVGRLDHPNVVAAYDADEIDGRWFLVMKYVDGTDLGSLVEQRGPLAVSLAMSCIVQAARGLEYAHRRGIFHRDIKPKNLLLDRDGTLMILDLGLARFDLPQSPDETSQITETGQLLGTVDFMSPEQAADMRLSDGRSDIYSLGYTLYYLLTGKLPYSGGERIERLMAHWEQPAPSLREACPDASEMLEQVFQKMVAKKPADRYQTVTEVLTDLERCRTAEMAVSIPATRASEAQELDDFLAILARAKPDCGSLPEIQVNTFGSASTQQAKDSKRAATDARKPGRRTRTSKPGATRGRRGQRISLRAWLWLFLLASAIVIAVSAMVLLPGNRKTGQGLPVREAGHPATAKSPSDSPRELGLPPVFVENDPNDIALFNQLGDLKNWTEVGRKNTWKEDSKVANKPALLGGSAAWLLYDNPKTPGNLIRGDFALKMDVLVPKNGVGEILIGATKDGQAESFLRVRLDPVGESPVNERVDGHVRVPVTADAWTTVTVRVAEGHVTVWPGGQSTALSRIKPQRSVLPGSVGLGSPQQSAAFRSVWLKDLRARNNPAPQARL
jgi:serine/threonine protein kinase